MATINTDSSISSTIRTLFREHKYGVKNVDESYKLEFEIGGKRYSTVINFYEGSMNISKNKKKVCISIEVGEEEDTLESSIEANSMEKQCFNPVLVKDNLPEGITQTDIIQVLSTKLKFAALKRTIQTITLRDQAQLINPDTHKKSSDYFSSWRLLRGEPTLYEKYGYTNKDLDNIRRVVMTTKWKEIKDIQLYNDKKNIKLNEFGDILKFNDEDTIDKCMKKIPYFEAEKFSVSNGTKKITLIDMIVQALHKKKGIFQDGIFEKINELEVSRTSPIWNKWDRMMKFVSLKLENPIKEGGVRKKRRINTKKKSNTRR